MRLIRNKDAGFTVKTGSPLPLGAEVCADGINFAVVSAGATAVSIVFFLSGEHKACYEIELDPAQNRTGAVWHALIGGLPEGIRYGYRLDGPCHASRGLQFDRRNILVDPYAVALTGGAVWGKPLVREGADEYPFTFLRRCFLPNRDFDWQGDRPIGRPLAQSVIYELHVRGFTIDPGSGVAHPGTFRGLTEKIGWLRELGVTAVELMPVNEFDEEAGTRVNPETGERLLNYWGYNPYAFFAPKASYAASAMTGGQVDEFKEMVRELHRAGIEVILDVVFNHTGEGGHGGPVFSFRGLDNDIYYMIDEDGAYRNFSGCGNTMNCNHPRVRRLIIDCLHYWVAEMHVDGFRFDLASVLGRDQQGNVLANPPILEEIAQDPVLAATKIIAEAWDAAGLYQVGSFPAWGRWAEWNGRFRDDCRRFLTDQPGAKAAMATRIAGSSDLYSDDGRSPQHSINFITCHDGFTLHDLFSYSKKRNLANGEDDRDGENHNISCNCGVEGETTRPGVRRLRERQAKNAFLLLMLSQGTPMILAGDEFLRSQGGNNNAYCQDNGTSWVDWTLAGKNAGLARFVGGLTRLRSRLRSLRRETFFAGADTTGCGIPDIAWFDRDGREEDFSDGDNAFGFMIAGLPAGAGFEPTLFAACNPTARPVRFTLPRGSSGCWLLKADSAARSPADFIADGDERPWPETTFSVRPRAMAVFLSAAIGGEDGL